MQKRNRAQRFKVLALALGLCGAELVARFSYQFLPGFQRTRQLMIGEAKSFHTEQAYLNYIPTPGYSNSFGVQHNRHGYRGEEVPLRRTPKVARVLCLGGSTTYGYGADRPDESYPARLEKILSENAPAGVEGVEVINGGVCSGTTAEALAYYHHKFRFYKPDLVVANPGMNDSMGSFQYPHYHPDHSHYRLAFQVPRPLPNGSRLLAKGSYLFSAGLTLLVHGSFVESTTVMKPFHAPPDAAWYDNSSKPIEDIPMEETSFFNDTRSLIREAGEDGARVLLVPVTTNPRFHGEFYTRSSRFERGVLQRLSREEDGVSYAPFPANVIQPSQWIDDCHNNPEGQNAKAWHVAVCAAQVLWGKEDARRLKIAERSYLQGSGFPQYDSQPDQFGSRSGAMCERSGSRQIAPFK